MSSKTVLLLTDSATGNSNQARALARILLLDYEEIRLEYNWLAELPLHFGNGLKILSKIPSQLILPRYNIIISAGRRAAIIALAIKKMNPNCKVIQILKPMQSFKKFDLVLLPYHDRKKYISYPNNVFFTHGAISYLPEEELKLEELKWQPILLKYKKPHLVILIGGNARKCKFSDHHIREFINLIVDIAKSYPGSLLISVSRRTPVNLIQGLTTNLNMLNINYFFYDKIDDLNNPYKALLASANQIIVTGDSISMCSEACSLKKPVYIFEPRGMISKKHRHFIQNLIENNIAMPLLTPDISQFHQVASTDINWEQKVREIVTNNIF